MRSPENTNKRTRKDPQILLERDTVGCGLFELIKNATDREWHVVVRGSITSFSQSLSYTKNAHGCACVCVCVGGVITHIHSHTHLNDSRTKVLSEQIVNETRIVVIHLQTVLDGLLHKLPSLIKHTATQ